MDKRDVPVSDWRELLDWVLRRRKRFRIAGYSMLPALRPGDEVLVNLTAYRRAIPRPGDIVLARHPHRRDVRVIKRIESVLDDDRFRLSGDNPSESTDSRSFGAVPGEQILGQVTSRLP